jgi:ABC-type glutathione transport system ATPase component
MNAILEGRHLVKTFTTHRGGQRQEIRAAGDVSVGVKAGEIVGLVGESGSGKTTVSRILIGIETATSGEVLHDGKPVRSKAEWKALRRDVQYVFQDPYTSLCPTMRVGDALAEPLLVHGIGSRGERAERVNEALGLVGLSAVMADRLPSQLSGGQRQRVSLARALMIRPRIVICDEIVSGLDVSVQAQVLTLLTDLQASLGLGLIFISHDLRVIRYLCDRVVVMYRGEIIEEGPVGDVFDAPRADYTRALLAAIPDPSRRGVPMLGRRAISLEGGAARLA